MNDVGCAVLRMKCALPAVRGISTRWAGPWRDMEIVGRGGGVCKLDLGLDLQDGDSVRDADGRSSSSHEAFPGERKESMTSCH